MTPAHMYMNAAAAMLVAAAISVEHRNSAAFIALVTAVMNLAFAIPMVWGR